MLAGFMRWSDLLMSRAEAMEARGTAAQAEAARFHGEAQLAEAEAARVLLQAELDATRGALQTSQLQAETVRAQLQAELDASQHDAETSRSEAATAVAALAASERRAADLGAEVERLRAAASVLGPVGSVRDRLPPDFSYEKNT